MKKYIRVNQAMYYENTIASLLGIVICFICVIYLINQINEKNKFIDFLFERYQVIQKYEEPKNETEIKELETQKETIEYVYNVTNEEKELLAKLLYCEGGIESEQCQRAIVSVIFNRLESGYWGNTLNDVIYAKGQFEPVAKGLLEKAKPKQEQYNVIDYILKNGSTLPGWVQYFRANYHFDWKGYSPYCSLSHTYFGGIK